MWGCLGLGIRFSVGLGVWGLGIRASLGLGILLMI